MTQGRNNKGTQEIKAMMAEDADFLRPVVRSVIQEFLEAEMAEAGAYLWAEVISQSARAIR